MCRGFLMFYNGAALLIQSVESDINGYLNNVWSVPITIALNDNNANPKIAASLSGNVIYTAAVWLNYNGVNNVVVGSTGSRMLLLPPTNLAVRQSVQNFGVFREYQNILTWSASTDPNTVGYLIFRNGVYLTQVDASVLQCVDNNRTVNDASTYSLTAIDSQQSQSATVSVSFP